MKRAELVDVAERLRAIAKVIEADFADPDTDVEHERLTAALILRSQASALDILAD